MSDNHSISPDQTGSEMDTSDASQACLFGADLLANPNVDRNPAVLQIQLHENEVKFTVNLQMSAFLIFFLSVKLSYSFFAYFNAALPKTTPPSSQRTANRHTKRLRHQRIVRSATCVHSFARGDRGHVRQSTLPQTVLRAKQRLQRSARLSDTEPTT